LILARHFGDEFCRENKMPKKPFSPEAKDKLITYRCPGNVHELKPIVDLANVMSDQEQVNADDISFSTVSKNKDVLINDSMTLNDYVRKIIKSYPER
jgi:DNA-binding NtrC family response regulator